MTPHTRTDDRALDDAVAWVLGSMPAADRPLYASHLAACPLCRAEVDALARTSTELARLAETEPDQTLAARLEVRLDALTANQPASASASAHAASSSNAHANPSASAHAGSSASAHAPSAATGASCAATPPRGGATASGAAPAAPAAQPWRQWAADVADDMFLSRADDSAWEPTAHPGVETRRLFVDAAARRATMLIRMAAGTSYPAHVHGGIEECFVLEGEIHVGDTTMHAGDFQRCETASRHGIQSTRTGCTLLIVSSLDDEIVGGD